MTDTQYVIEEFKPFIRNTLRGFARVRLPDGMIVCDVTVHCQNDSVWAVPPGKPILDKNGQTSRDESNKIRYVRVISFATSQAREDFSARVIEAVKIAFPDALA